MIIVSPYDRIDAAVERYRPTAAISLIDNAATAPVINNLPETQHLKLSLSMAEAEMMTMPCPSEECGRIEKIISFAKQADWRHAMLIHCRLGLSRSPAAAFIIQCALAPDRDEAHIAQEMRQISSKVDPSLMMISMADDLLGRDGRMIDAIEALEPPEDCLAGDIFEVPFLPVPA